MTGKDFTCVWLDNQLLRSEEYRDTQDKIRELFENFKEFSKPQQCLDFITNFFDGQILLITSSNLAKNLLLRIHSDKRIASIYLFFSSKTTDNQWAKDYSKIKGIVSDIRLIPSRIQQERNRDPIALSFVSSTDIISSGENRQDPSFMYFQLLKEVLTHNYLLESDQQSKEEMLAYCREVKAHNPTAIVILDEFEKDFIPELAIYWYTRECFLHQMLNRALWKVEIDVLYRLRYFLRHLHKQIVAEGKKQRASLSKMIVYRGQSISEDQIEKIKNNLGGFLSFNNFLSTSLQKDVALNFLFGSNVGVLFEMHIDPSVQDIPIVNIERIPYLQTGFCEHELLFSMGSVFRIVEIAQENDYYRVKLTLSENMDEQLAAYTSVTRQQIGFTHCFLSLLRLMNQLSDYTYLDRFSQILRNDRMLNSNILVSASIYQFFGLIYLNREQLKESLEHSEKALEVYLTYLPANHQNLTPVYNNIGCVYLARSNYEKALEYQQLALDCQICSDQPELSSIIIYTNNVGKIYSRQEKYDEALTYHKRALELQQQFLGENDPSIAETYGYLSSVYRNQGNFEQANLYREKANTLEESSLKLDPKAAADHSIKLGSKCLLRKQFQDALSHFHQALDIQQQYFLPNHPSLATTNNHIARTYFQQDRFEESLPYYLKALEIEQNSLANDHSSIATSYHNISTAYIGLNRWSEAEEYSYKSVEQSKKSLLTDVNAIALFTHNLGHIYHEQEKYELAIVSYQESLELYQMHLKHDDPSLLIVYHRTARVYFHLQMYTEALILYEKALHIALKVLQRHDHQIATIYFDLSQTLLKLKQFDEASIACEQAIEQALMTLPYNHPQISQYKTHLDSIKRYQIFA
ncbi:unnamed protein product [Adineta ricciae]|uniref:Uncharacterized protein n=1 Tax=Adineta ricciae TaxID=249248 RepID=A0A814XJR0_ADIRI|nr:unnamed protein product [Adineta ricciae]CAF1216871.1 unnamed protein product [Adineta ricciae]